LSFVSFANHTKAEGLDDMSAGSECKEGVKKIKDLYRINGMFWGKFPELPGAASKASIDIDEVEWPTRMLECQATPTKG
jgi:hypothetical protein